MHVVDNSADRISTHPPSKRPVIVDEWAEAVVDLRRAQSRRRHPSNHEPAWQKDGGYEPTEWAI